MKFRNIVLNAEWLLLRLVLACCGVSATCAAPTDLANEPLNNATTAKVLPNILFILDDSGSMNLDYVPDEMAYACLQSSSSISYCRPGDPPYYLSTFNSMYYDPGIDYLPPKNADGTSMMSYTAVNSSNWTRVPLDGYAPGQVSNLIALWRDMQACDAGGRCTPLVVGNLYAYPNSGSATSKTLTYTSPYYYTAKVEWCSQRDLIGYGTGDCQALGDATHRYVRFSNWNRVNIVPTRNAYPGAKGATRTYAEEMTNFANWHAWYRTRILLTKTALSNAFEKIRGIPNDADPNDRNYLHARVGLSKTTDYEKMGVDGDSFLAINTFDPAHKALWFKRMTGAIGAGLTPSRATLYQAGQIFAGRRGPDPVQYSCQRNFIIFASDGGWNDDSFKPFTRLDGSGDIGNVDTQFDAKGAIRPSFDALRIPNTLADIAHYYYHTDLRTPALGNCNGALRPDGTRGDVCTNDVSPVGAIPNVDDVATHQHITLFTIGLGVNGVLDFRPDYKTANSGAYFDILQGSRNWPDPSNRATTAPRIDDLWHAAVNGRGTYFSARDPGALKTALESALLGTQTEQGAGAAAASGSLNPTRDTSGSNLQYVATYRTRTWDGDVVAKPIDLGTRQLQVLPVWQASPLLDARRGASTDSRTIYVSVDGKRKSFDYGNLNASQQAYFDNARLSQYATWGDGYKSAASGKTLVNYLRGHDQFEDQSGNDTRLYRDREHVLGDIVHSQPIHLKGSSVSYDMGHDPSYGGRMGILYVAANDGMLHAFCTETVGTCTPGKELWAYVIPTALPNLWYLADKRYTAEHRFMVDGPLMVADAYFGGGWKTILIGALGKGGRGYYAFDVTVPDDPKFLWTFTQSDNPNVGFSFGSAEVSKLDINGDGRADNREWRVVVPSGYNNVPNLPNVGDASKADGGGYLFILDPATGALQGTIPTGSGSVTSPSGLAHIQADVPTRNRDNTGHWAYGGDLNGDLWRFDLLTRKAEKILALGSSRPITASVEITEIQNGILGIYFGTGRYLGSQDLLNNSATRQVFGAVRATATGLTLDKLIEQTGSAAVPDWSKGNGWYRTLPAGEQVHLKPLLELGNLQFSTAKPSASECKPGASSVLYQIDYSTGKDLQSPMPYDSLIVGMSFLNLPGKSGSIVVTGDGRVRFVDSPNRPPPPPPPAVPLAGQNGRRIMWRELID